jgi:hypothetical protein
MVRIDGCGIGLNEEGFRLEVEEHALGFGRIEEWLCLFWFGLMILSFPHHNIMFLPFIVSLNLTSSLCQYLLSSRLMRILNNLCARVNNLCTELIIKFKFFMLDEIRWIGLRDEHAFVFLLVLARFGRLV